MACAKKKRQRRARTLRAEPPAPQEALAAAAPRRESMFHGRGGWALALVLILTAAAHSASLGHSIDTWDDEVHITDYRPIRDLSGHGIQFLFTDKINQTYIPLTALTWALEYHVFKYSPRIYHVNNILLHVLVTGLVFGLARRMGMSLAAAVLGGLIFGLHPLRVESVAWATERKDVLYAFFYLLSLHQYWRYLQAPPVGEKDRRRRAYVLSLVFGLLSILSKAMALSLPLVLWTLDYIAQRRWSWRMLADKMVYLLYIVPIAFYTYVSHARFPGRTVQEAALTWTWTLVFYWRKFLWPVDLRPLYNAPKPVTLSNPQYLLPVLALAGMAYLLWRWRRDRWFVFANAYFFLSIFFLLRFDTMVDANIVADRFMYLPGMGYGLWMAQKVWTYYRSQREHPEVQTFVAGCVVLVIGAMGVKTFRQTAIWKDDFALWSYLLSKDENSHWAHFGLGQCYYEQGDPARALQHYRRTLELKPDHAKALNNVGDFVYAQGKTEEAKQYFAAATVAKPDYAEAHNNFGVLLMDEGNFKDAKAHIDIALALKPDFPDINLSLGDWYYRQGKNAEAAKLYERARELAPENPQVYNRLGVLRLKAGDLQGAIVIFQKALTFDPGNSFVKNNLDYARSLLAKPPDTP